MPFSPETHRNARGLVGRTVFLLIAAAAIVIAMSFIDGWWHAPSPHLPTRVTVQ